MRRTVHSPELESSAAWFPRFKESLVYKDHGNRVDRTLEYILLDFEPNSTLLFTLLTSMKLMLAVTT